MKKINKSNLLVYIGLLLIFINIVTLFTSFIAFPGWRFIYSDSREALDFSNPIDLYFGSDPYTKTMENNKLYWLGRNYGNHSQIKLLEVEFNDDFSSINNYSLNSSIFPHIEKATYAGLAKHHNLFFTVRNVIHEDSDNSKHTVDLISFNYEGIVSEFNIYNLTQSEYQETYHGVLPYIKYTLLSYMNNNIYVNHDIRINNTRSSEILIYSDDGTLLNHINQPVPWYVDRPYYSPQLSLIFYEYYGSYYQNLERYQNNEDLKVDERYHIGFSLANDLSLQEELSVNVEQRVSFPLVSDNRSELDIDFGDPYVINENLLIVPVTTEGADPGLFVGFDIYKIHSAYSNLYRYRYLIIGIGLVLLPILIRKLNTTRSNLNYC